MIPRRPPAWLKRLVLPAWNGGHHLARRAGDVARAIGSRSVGNCECCGRPALFVYRRRVIPPELERRWGLSPRLAEAVARKESMECSRCGAKLRGRRLALTLLDLYPTGPPSGSLAAWAGSPEARTLRVAEINRIEGVHDAIGSIPGVESPDYSPGAPPGSVVEGVRSEDLTALTYPDEAFDLVLTSETLEHVPDLGRALRETWRVLKPGGRHVFTVPLLPGVPKTFARATLGPEGRKVDLVEPSIAHPGGDVGYPVFTEFGADFPEIVRRAGFEVEVRFGPTTEDDVAQVYIATKPAFEKARPRHSG